MRLSMLPSYHLWPVHSYGVYGRESFNVKAIEVSVERLPVTRTYVIRTAVLLRRIRVSRFYCRGESPVTALLKGGLAISPDPVSRTREKGSFPGAVPPDSFEERLRDTRKSQLEEPKRLTLPSSKN